MTTRLHSQEDRQCDGAPFGFILLHGCALEREAIMKESTKLGNVVRAAGLG
jgi:hypothetical protein